MIHLNQAANWSKMFLGPPLPQIKLGALYVLSSFSMTKEFALDLKVARKNSGLTQEDCAHLLGVCDATAAKMEGGTRTPTVREICTFVAYIWAQFREPLQRHLHLEVREDLFQRLMKMPVAPGTLRLRSNRQYTLGKLPSRLSEGIHCFMRAPCRAQILGAGSRYGRIAFVIHQKRPAQRLGAQLQRLQVRRQRRQLYRQLDRQIRTRCCPFVEDPKSIDAQGSRHKVEASIHAACRGPIHSAMVPQNGRRVQMHKNSPTSQAILKHWRRSFRKWPTSYPFASLLRH